MLLKVYEFRFGVSFRFEKIKMKSNFQALEVKSSPPTCKFAFHIFNTLLCFMHILEFVDWIWSLTFFRRLDPSLQLTSRLIWLTGKYRGVAWGTLLRRAVLWRPGDGTAGLRAEQGDHPWMVRLLRAQQAFETSSVPSSKVWIANVKILIFYFHNYHVEIEMVNDPCVIPIKINYIINVQLFDLCMDIFCTHL